MRQFKNREILPEIRNWVIDYERINELCDGAQIEGVMGTINTKGISNKNIKIYVDRLQEILHNDRLMKETEFGYIIDTLKYNKNLVNLRQDKIEKVLKN